MSACFGQFLRMFAILSQAFVKSKIMVSTQKCYQMPDHRKLYKIIFIIPSVFDSFNRQIFNKNIFLYISNNWIRYCTVLCTLKKISIDERCYLQMGPHLSVVPLQQPGEQSSQESPKMTFLFVSVALQSDTVTIREAVKKKVGEGITNLSFIASSTSITLKTT